METNTIITITYCRVSRFSDEYETTEATFILPIVTTKATDLAICEEVFEATNTYSGLIWETIKPILPENRSHTAISEGDMVSVNGRKYLCDFIGWEEVK